MNKQILKIEYYIESDTMTDDEFANQLPNHFIVTEDMLVDLINESLPNGQGCVEDELYIVKL
jgi:hypothetical protein